MNVNPLLGFSACSFRGGLSTASRVVAAISGLVFLSASVHATIYTYTAPNSTTSNTWSSGTAWSAVPVSAVDTTLVFAGSFAGAVTATSQDNIAGAFQLNAMTLSASNSSTFTTSTYNITTTGGTLNFINNGGTTAVVNLSSNNGGNSANINTNVSIDATIDGGSLTFQGNGSGGSTSNGFTYSGILSDGATSAGVIKNGTSVLTLSGANTFTGGLTLNAGSVYVNNAKAVGTGTMTVAGGILNNTSGSAITLFNNNVQNWTGNFAWAGSNDLNLGNGAVTLGANRAISFLNGNISSQVSGSGALTVGGVIADGGANYSLTVGNAGRINTQTVVLGNTANTYGGGTVIESGVVQAAGIGSLGAAGQNVRVNSGATLSAAYAIDQATLQKLTSNSTGSVALAGVNSSNNLDFSSAGVNLPVSLGATGTATYSGTLTPQGQTYRLGGGFGTLNMTNVLGDVNAAPTALVVGSGGSSGTVNLNAAGTYSGGTTVTGIPGSTASVLQTNVLTGASNMPFGSNAAITLNNGTLGLGSVTTLSAGNVMNVSGYNVTFDTGTIKLSVGSGTSVTFTANTLNQSSLGGVLYLAPTSGASLGTTEKVFVTNASATIPLAVTNGMVSPKIIDSTNKTFLTYDGVNGFKDATTTTVVGANNVVSVAASANAQASAYAYRMTSGVLQASDNITLGAGGFLSTVTQNNATGTLNYGSTPGFYGIYASGSATTAFNATGGMTFYGTGAGFNGVNLNISGGLTFASGSWNFTPQPTGSEIFQTANPNALILLSGASITESQNSKMTFASIEGSGAINETLNNGFTLTINGLNSTGSTTFSGAINGAVGGTGNIIKTGANTQVFSGANSYNGTTTINGGTLVFDTTTNATVLSTSTALGLGGGTFQLKGASGAARSQTFSGLSVNSGANVVDANNVAGGTSTTITLGNITRTAGSTVDFKASNGALGSTALVGTTKANDASGILGAWATVNGGADFAANNGSNSIVAYTGYTDIDALSSTIADGTTSNVRLNTAANSAGNVALGATTTNINTLMQNTATAATVDVAGKTLRTGILGGIVITPTGQALTIGTAANSGVLTAGGNATNTAGELLLTNSSANTLTINSTVTNNGTGAVAVTKSGGGLTVLSGTNTYTGATTINAGTLRAGSTSALGSNSAVTLANVSGVTLDVNGFNNTVGSLNGGGIIGGNVSLGSGTLTTGGGNGAGSYAGVISGTGGLTKTGTGTQTLSGANTYSGTTTIGSGGTLQLGSGSTTGSLASSGAIINNGTLTINRSNAVAQGTDFSSAAITGTGAFVQAGSGTTTLNAANTYTGATSINAGTLVASTLNTVGGGASSSSLGAPTTTGNGTIAIGSSTTSGQLTVIGTGETTNRVINLAGTTGNGTIDQSGTGLLKFTSNFTATGAGAKALTLQGSTAGTGEIGGAIVDNTTTNFTRVIKSGTGTWTLGGNNSYTGSTTLNAGTLKLDYATNNTSKLSNTATNGTLLLNGGTLELSGGSHVETVLSTTLTTGLTFIKQTNGGTSTLSMGAITFTSGAINFGAGSIATTTSANDATGILSQRAIVAGADFAKNDGANNIVAYTGYTAFAGTMAANTNYSLAGSSSIAGAVGAATDTLKITTTAGGQSLALGANALTTGAILFAGANDYVISTSGAGAINTTLLHNYGAGTLSLGALGGTLTQYGTGKTILTTAATADNSLTVNGGTVQFSNNLQIGTNASVKTITLNNGTIVADTTGASIALDNSGGNARNIALGNGGGTIDVIGGNTLTISGFISGSAPATFGSNTSNGTITLTSANTYTGQTTISGGTLQLGNGGTTGALSTSSSIVNNGNLTINRSNAVTQGTDFKAAAITGTGSFTQAGSGTTTLNVANTYSGNTTISAGTLALGASGSFANSPVINVGTSASQGILDLTAKSSFAFGSAQTLSGYGTVNIGSGKMITINGTLAPGNSPGILNVIGDLTLGSASTTNMEIISRNAGAPVAGTDFDRAAVTGALVFGGTLNINTAGLTGLTNGDNFQLFTANTYTAGFTSVVMSGAYAPSFTNNVGTWTGSDQGLNFTFTESTGILSVGAIPEPSTFALFGGMITLVIACCRRRRCA